MVPHLRNPQLQQRFSMRESGNNQRFWRDMGVIGGIVASGH
jgi:uncharacterized iron-regulated membrane protein